jgi:thiamine biosynthesis lipoprotein
LAIGLIWTAARAVAGEEYLIAGRTMGTRYSIKVVADSVEKIRQIKARVDNRLEQINQSMSTYRADSEISLFNALQEIGKPFAVSDDFFRVMQAGRQIYHLSQGAWDGTVQPLVKLWGFDKGTPIDQLPSTAAIARAKELVGFDGIDVSSYRYLKKRRQGVTVDLASIAKGYGVDQVAALISRMGFTRYIVEIGGEVFAAGLRADGASWRVGINRPQKGGSINAVYRVVALQDQAMATSGDYRNFIEIDGRTYSHIIDPRSGSPVANGVVSASVVAKNCTMADGLATGLVVMGPQAGLALLNRLDGIEGLIVVQGPDGVLTNHWSSGLVDNSR